MSTETIYKIRDKMTGLFSTGGAFPRWTARGKSWSSLTYVKSHLGLVDNGRWGNKAHPYINAEIVTFDVTISGTMNVQLLLDKVGRGQEAKLLAAKNRASQRRDDRERAELRRLRKRWPDDKGTAV